MKYSSLRIGILELFAISENILFTSNLQFSFSYLEKKKEKVRKILWRTIKSRHDFESNEEKLKFPRTIYRMKNYVSNEIEHLFSFHIFQWKHSEAAKNKKKEKIFVSRVCYFFSLKMCAHYFKVYVTI